MLSLYNYIECDTIYLVKNIQEKGILLNIFLDKISNFIMWRDARSFARQRKGLGFGD